MIYAKLYITLESNLSAMKRKLSISCVADRWRTSPDPTSGKLLDYQPFIPKKHSQCLQVTMPQQQQPAWALPWQHWASTRHLPRKTSHSVQWSAETTGSSGTWLDCTRSQMLEEAPYPWLERPKRFGRAMLLSVSVGVLQTFSYLHLLSSKNSIFLCEIQYCS